MSSTINLMTSSKFMLTMSSSLVDGSTTKKPTSGTNRTRKSQANWVEVLEVAVKRPKRVKDKISNNSNYNSHGPTSTPTNGR